MNGGKDTDREKQRVLAISRVELRSYVRMGQEIEYRIKR